MKVKLKELGNIVTGTTPKTSNKIYYENSNYMFVGPADLQNGKFIRKSEKHISDKAYIDYQNRFINKNDICISCIGYLGYVAMAQEKLLTNQQINSITNIDNQKVLPEYLYYKLLSIKPIFESLGGAGSAVPIINKSTFENIEIDLHDLNVQHYIVDILGTLDEKIENNIKKSEKLKAFLIKKYENLLRFEPNIEGCIGDLAIVKSGYAFKSSNWSDDGIKVIKIKNITESGIVDFSECSCISDSIVIKKAEPFVVKGGELIIAMTGATIGKMALVPKLKPFGLVNQRVGLFFPKKNNLCTPFLYASTQRNEIQKEIETRGAGSAQPNISGQSIENIKIPLVNSNLIDNFDNQYGCILEYIQNLMETNTKLNELKQLYLKKFFG